MITVQNETNSPFKTVNFSKSNWHNLNALNNAIINFVITLLTLEINGTQSAYLGGFGITKPTNVLNVELDVEKRMQADVLKRQIRIKQFFHDFDRLRKGNVGEAGVSTILDNVHKLLI